MKVKALVTRVIIPNAKNGNMKVSLEIQDLATQCACMASRTVPRMWCRAGSVEVGKVYEVVPHHPTMERTVEAEKEGDPSITYSAEWVFSLPEVVAPAAPAVPAAAV